MDYEEALQGVIELLTNVVEQNNAQYKRMNECIMASEKRVDRINEMVLNLTSVMAEMTTAYTKHIDRIATSRDELIKQNSKFIDVLEEIREESNKSNVRYDKLLDRYEHLAEHKSQTNQIRVN